MRLLVVLLGSSALAACFSPEGAGSSGATGTSEGSGSTSTGTTAPATDATSTTASTTATPTSDPTTTDTPITSTTGTSDITATATSSPATSDSTTEAPFCGDGMVNGREECDDGNLTNVDGCDETCTLEVPVRYVFVTSVDIAVTALGGVEAGDAICNDLAHGDQGVLPLQSRNFRAWLSEKDLDAIDRLTPWEGPYVLPNLTPVTTGTIGFSLGSLLAPIDVDETGAKAIGGDCLDTPNAGVWTGTKSDGTEAIDQICMGWSSQIGDAVVGGFGQMNGSWTNCTLSLCAENHRLYCIEV